MNFRLVSLHVDMSIKKNNRKSKGNFSHMSWRISLPLLQNVKFSSSIFHIRCCLCCQAFHIFYDWSLASVTLEILRAESCLILLQTRNEVAISHVDSIRLHSSGQRSGESICFIRLHLSQWRVLINVRRRSCSTLKFISLVLSRRLSVLSILIRSVGTSRLHNSRNFFGLRNFPKLMHHWRQRRAKLRKFLRTFIYQSNQIAHGRCEISACTETNHKIDNLLVLWTCPVANWLEILTRRKREINFPIFQLNDETKESRTE